VMFPGVLFVHSFLLFHSTLPRRKLIRSTPVSSSSPPSASGSWLKANGPPTAAGTTILC
jgi:hypothetical protein